MDILSIREDFISGKVDLISFYTDVIKRIEDKKDLNIFLDFSKEKIMERVEFLNNKLKNKIKDLLLSNSTIEKSFEMGNLKFNIKLIYTKEYINFYKGKRKIIFN